jgi:ankyrin repeat protein
MDHLNQTLKDAISSGSSMDEKEFLRIFNDEIDCDEHVDAFCEAIRGNNKAIIKLFLKAGVDPNGFSEECNILPLGCAARHCDLETVKLLVAAGSDPNKGDDEGHDTPLMDACWKGRYEILKYLIEDADGIAELHDNDGETLLSAASCGGDLDTVRYLVETAGLDPKYRGEGYFRWLKNPLLTAFQCDDNGGIIDYLIDKVDINEIDADGKTILMLTVENPYIHNEDARIEIVKNILSKKPNMVLRDKSNNSAWHLCDGAKHPKLMKVLDDVYDDYPEALV